ncbi:hypothetical protein [Cupriavidus consociatus]|uniref:hypothetical protein n=1 Tax=Cupriavidus consociatus TaxID=2821357 RepID=UPI001AE6EBFE|nr:MULTISPECIES: hypothetical protein [unclassified Cupriavidus]MBP0619240.1 hypothetical protein [Cupriavidus sp. LEh25]MDK2655886.1 hypothetical protein [Cupriavidus sp. LEh21]
MPNETDYDSLAVEVERFWTEDLEGKGHVEVRSFDNPEFVVTLVAVARDRSGRCWLRCKDGTRRYSLLWWPAQFYFAGSRPDDELIRPKRAREPGLLE